ncbi:hypothetical protein Tco_1372044, partial [Tanacetum coccineum]
NDPRDFAKPVEAITLPQDVPSTFDRRLIEFENQAQCLMKAHLAPTQPTQVNKVNTSCEIYSGPHDTKYCMEDPKQAFVEYASSRTDEAGGLVSNFMASQDARLSKFEADFKQQQSEMTNKIDTVLKAITDRIAGALPSDTVKNPKLSASLVLSARSYRNMDSQCLNHVQGSINTIIIHSEKQSDSYDENAKENEKEEKDTLGLVPRSSNTEVICTKGDDGEVMFIELIRKNDDSSEGEPEEEGSTTTEGVGAEYFDIFPSRSELAYHKVIDPNSSLGKICLEEDVVVISSDKVKGSRDWNCLEFQDTANSGQKKAMVFYQLDTEEVSDRFVAPCFVNGLEAYDGEINLGVEENMISNKYAVKLCLEHEVKRGNKVVKKELIVALRGEIYFVKFIINLEEDDVEPGVIFGEEGLPPFVCKMGKSSRKATKNLNFFYQDIGTSSLAGGHLTQEEAAKEAIAIRMSRKFALLEEERPIIKTMTYNDKYKKILNEVWKDKVELDGKIVKEEKEAVKRIKGEALKEKEDPRAFIFPFRLYALADTGSDINTMPFRLYVQLGRDNMKKVDKGITMINHTQAEAI